MSVRIAPHHHPIKLSLLLNPRANGFCHLVLLLIRPTPFGDLRGLSLMLPSPILSAAIRLSPNFFTTRSLARFPLARMLRSLAVLATYRGLLQDGREGVQVLRVGRGLGSVAGLQWVRREDRLDDRPAIGRGMGE